MPHGGDIAGLGAVSGALLPFAANMSRANCRRQAFDLLASLARSVGFADLSLTIEDVGAGAGSGGLPASQRWTTLTAERAASLQASGFGAHDPVRRFARRVCDPFIWTHHDWPGDRSPSAQAAMGGLRRASIEAGMTVPAWGKAGRMAFMDAFGTEQDVRGLSPFVGDILYLATAQTVRVIGRLSAIRDMPPLTSREVEILELAAQGLCTRAIASRLRIVEPTVKFHFKGIREKMNARTRAEAVARFATLEPSLAITAAVQSHMNAGVTVIALE